MGLGIKLLILLSATTALVDLNGCGGQQQQASAPGNPHPALSAYYRMSVKWLQDEHLKAFKNIDVRNTDSANDIDLAFLAADRAVRLFAPISLETTGLAKTAEQLRDLVPLSNRELAQKALNESDTELAAAYMRSTQNAPPGHFGEGPGQVCTDEALRYAATALVTAIAAGKAAKPSEARTLANKTIDMSARTASTTFQCVFETYQAFDREAKSSKLASDQQRVQEVLVKRAEIERGAVELLDDLVLLALRRAPTRVSTAGARSTVVHHKEQCTKPQAGPTGAPDYDGCLIRAERNGRHAEVKKWCATSTGVEPSTPPELVGVCPPHLVAARYLSGDEIGSAEDMTSWCDIPVEVNGRSRKPDRKTQTNRAAQAACRVLAVEGEPASTEDEDARKAILRATATVFAKSCRTGRRAVEKQARSICEGYLQIVAE